MSVEISIITVAFNSEKTIRKTIESVLAQSYMPKEYIIVDGKSTDATLEVVGEYEEKFREKGVEYRVISEKDKGIYDAMNKGIAMAQGEVVGMINSDDWYEPNALEVVAETYKKEKFDMMYADINLIKENGTVILKKAKYKKYITSRDWNHPTTFITKEVYKHIQYRLDSLYADLDVLIKVRKSGYKIVTVNKLLANFMMGGASNKKTLKDMWKRIWIRYDVYRSNGYSRFYILECLFQEVGKFVLS